MNKNTENKQSIHQFLKTTDSQILLNSPILIIGAGGIGCELLKCLILTGFNNLVIVWQ